MNELVAKIYMQARKNIVASKTPLESLGPVLQEFAELIIKETLEVVRDEVQYALDDYLAETIDLRVKTHFGIEE